MATADQVKALVKSHAEGDDSHFYSVAIQVAAKAARSGNVKYAQELRDLIDELRRQGHQKDAIASVVPVAQPRGELASILSVTYPTTRLSDLVLSPPTHVRLKQVLTEQRQQALLGRHGLMATRKLLLIGPPGTGKTTTAHAIAGELGLPLFSVRLESILTKFMGETAAKLRMAFDALAQTKGVYLFDEIDALGSDRSARNDVGEIRRVLNSFLQFLEEDKSDSIVIGATNNPQLLDPALFRRFEVILEFHLPSASQVKEVIENRLSRFQKSRLGWTTIVSASSGLSHAEVVSAVDNAMKVVVLSGRDKILTTDLVDALQTRSVTSLGRRSE